MVSYLPYVLELIAHPKMLDYFRALRGFEVSRIWQKMAKIGQKWRNLSVLGTFEPKQLINRFAQGTSRRGKMITRADRAGQIYLFMRDQFKDVR